MSQNSYPNVIIPADSTLFHALDRMARDQRMVFLAGIPGVGKSLILNQLAHIAHARERIVHLMQWDICRQPFETDSYIQAHYPEVDGVTHGVIRKAVGLWARDAVKQWHEQNAGVEHLLIGELSMVGNRLIELVRPEEDEIESVLGSTDTRFAIPVPSPALRQVIEGNREERSANPQHEREQADAIPKVMHALWAELYRVAHAFGVIPQQPEGDTLRYDTQVYEGVFSALLKHRHHEVLSIDIRLSTEHLSVYDLDIHQSELIPTPEDVAAYTAEVERRYPDEEALDQEMARWYQV